MRKIAITLVGLLCSAAASAEILTFEYTGVINTLREYQDGKSHQVVTSNIIPRGVRVGDDFHGSFSIDTTSPLGYNDGTTVIYYPIFHDKAPATTITMDKTGTSTMTAEVASSVMVSKDAIGASVWIEAPWGGIPGGSLSLHFLSPETDKLPNLAIPTEFSPDGWYLAQVNLSWYGDASLNTKVVMEGMLTSITKVSAVPEAETYVMLIVGLVLVGMAARRKQQLGQ